MRPFLAALLLLLPLSLAGQSKLAAGPMAGYADMNLCRLWVQTTQPAEVRIQYWPIDAPAEKHWTKRVQTTEADHGTAHLTASEVAPGTTYEYALYIDGEKVQRPYELRFQTPEHWHHRRQPPELRIATGSCAYFNDPGSDRPGTPYGGEYNIFEAMAAKQPDLMLWLGDNLYTRETDWTSREGFFKRYTYARSYDELQPLLGITNHLAIWDDHDYGPNNADRSYLYKDAAREAFQQFWANPTLGLPGQRGITTSFTWADAQFFLLDDRYFRNSNRRKTGERSMLGEAQFNWLIDALTFSKATFKFVCIGGQVLNPAQRFETYANLFPQERRKLLQRIQQEEIPGVIFLSGDRHHSEITRYDLNNDFYAIPEFTISPLTATAHDATAENNTLRVEGSMIGVRNFAILTLTGEKDSRRLEVEYFDSDGESLNTYTVRASELQP